jgi:DNA processing protein
VPQGKYAEEAKSRGLLALTESTGTTLADLLGLKDDYRQLLIRRFHDHAPAFPLRSRADYPELLSRLSELMVSAAEGSAVTGLTSRPFEHATTQGDENHESGQGT